jgi:hypothetical protein
MALAGDDWRDINRIPLSQAAEGKKNPPMPSHEAKVKFAVRFYEYRHYVC